MVQKVSLLRRAARKALRVTGLRRAPAPAAVAGGAAPGPDGRMPFIPPMDGWVRTHYAEVPQRTIAEIGPLAGKRVLDVGCGDGLIAFGLANAGAAEVIALDVSPLPETLIEATMARIETGGFPEVRSRRPRISFRSYDGVNMPVESDSIDVAFSWGVFEHVADVKSVLLEMKRVMKPDGIGFIKVHPWFQSFYGSHLSDFTEPFAHLKRTPEEIHAQVVTYLDAHPEAPRGLILDFVWPEYRTLNKYSANQFYADFRTCGFRSHTWKLQADAMDLSAAPPGVPLSDLMICGSEVVFRK